jgi:hypothetical protein
MKSVIFTAVALLVLAQSAMASGFKCDGDQNYKGALEIHTTTFGDAAGESYTQVALTLNYKDITQYLVNQGAIDPAHFNANWNDTYYQNTQMADQGNGRYSGAEYFNNGNRTSILITRTGQGAILQIYANGPVVNGAAAYGPLLANWQFQQCTDF